MLEMTTSLGILGCAILSAVAVLGYFGLSVALTHRRALRVQRRDERVARWQANPRGAARSIAATFQEAKTQLTEARDIMATRRDQAAAALERYEQSLPARPAWKWALLVVLIPLTGVLLYTQVISDIASFAAQGRLAEISVVLGVALAVSLFAVPLFIRIHTDGAERGWPKTAWFAGLAFTTVFLVGVATLVAGGRGEAQFAAPMRSAVENLGYYESQGDQAATAAAQQHLADLTAQRDAVVEQDQFFAAGLSLAEAVFGWLEADSLAGAWLLAQRAHRRRLELALVRKNAALERHDRRVQRDIIRQANEAGVLDQLSDDGPEAPTGPALARLGAGDRNPDGPAQLEANAADIAITAATGNTDAAQNAAPAVHANTTVANTANADPDATGNLDANAVGAGGGPTGSTTNLDDNL
jgi:hypothetical protein